MILQEKAYQLESSQFDEPWFTPDEVFYGKTRSQAKSKALKEADGMTRWDKEETTFLNIKIKRVPEYDKYLIEGELKTLGQIKREQAYTDRAAYLKSLIEANPEAKAYIRKGGYYYRPNCCGYTERESDAGVYSIQKAVSEVLGCDIDDKMMVVVIDTEAHNKMILEKIEALKQQLIPMP